MKRETELKTKIIFAMMSVVIVQETTVDLIGNHNRGDETETETETERAIETEIETEAGGGMESGGEAGREGLMGHMDRKSLVTEEREVWEGERDIALVDLAPGLPWRVQGAGEWLFFSSLLAVYVAVLCVLFFCDVNMQAALIC